MRDWDTVSGMIRDLLAMLDPSEAPEVYDYLGSCVCGEAEPDAAAMDIVYDLRGMEPLPQLVWDFIFELLEKEVGAGNTDAMNELGMMYHDGIGCEVNFEKAVALFHMAAEKGDRQAQENLGYCYYYGRNMPVDYEKAYLYDMVMKGDIQYKKSLYSAIEGQRQAREALLCRLPEKEWTFDD